ncbi:ferrous iron transport protein A [Pontiella sp.]|uniref:FeoA family protein n=1 Tax=Pontiella sp. TaxID=2837462 RepID=UPI0035673439
MKLRELKEAENGVVTGFSSSDAAYRQQLLRMGFTRNAGFTVVRKAPLGGPIEVEIRGSRVVLRSDEADVLEVDRK